MNAINLSDVKWVSEVGVDVKDIEKHIANIKEVAKEKPQAAKAEKSGTMSKLKESIKKAVNCCIE